MGKREPEPLTNAGNAGEQIGMASQEQVDQYHDQGYFIADDAVSPDMLEQLSAAAHRAVAKVRAGEVVDDGEGIRTGGGGTEPEFVSGLIAPEFGEPVFAAYLGSEPIADHLRPFLGDELRMGWVHLACMRGEYLCGWHRDTAGKERDGGYELEMEVLGRHRSHFVKWHLALDDDPCLWIVPGSQRRYRTELEHECLINDTQGDIPGAVQIDLRRGQTIFWNSNTIHRGRKPDGMGDRATLMGALIDHRAAYDDAGEKGDHRWMLVGNVRDSVQGRTRRYYDNWLALAERRMAVVNGG